MYFLPLLLGLYYLVPGIRAKNVILGLASLLFYFWGGGFLVLMLPAAGFTAWILGVLIARTRFRGAMLALGVVLFMLLLIRFKYLTFLFENLGLEGLSGLPQFKTLNVLGVSFFTFQAVSYMADVYKKKCPAESNPLRVMLYIAMFPQLLSGPLVRYKALREQFRARTLGYENFAAGVRRFVAGLGKKVLIADTLSPLVAQIVDVETMPVSPLVAWAGMMTFAIQIFFDFSGYTDMAIGVGKMLGFKLPENFNYPYVSRSITDFWRRWHMSFTLWIKEYIFNPVAIGLRYWGQTGMMLALMLTFFVCGLWHGPSWNFVLWGTSQGVFLVVEELFLLRYLKKTGRFGIVYTLFIIVTCMVFFRTPDLAHAMAYFRTMFTMPQAAALGPEAFFAWKHLAALAAGILLCIPFKTPEFLKTAKMKPMAAYAGVAVTALVFMLALMQILSRTYMPFIYFQF